VHDLDATAHRTVRPYILQAENDRLRQALADEQAAHAKTISNFEDFADTVASGEYTLTVAGRAALDQAENTCRCSFLGHGTPAHQPSALCLPDTHHHEAPQAPLPTGVADYRMPLTDLERRAGVVEVTRQIRCAFCGAPHDTETASAACTHPVFQGPDAAASVPPVAREEMPLAPGKIIAEPLGLSLGDQHAVRQLVSPGRPPMPSTPLDTVLGEVAYERAGQDEQWGEQNHPDGTGQSFLDEHVARMARDACKIAAQDGTLTWRLILNEEFAEACAERDPDRLRAELVQVAAVTVAWIEAIDRRQESASS
jgi:hypothetical protein